MRCTDMPLILTKRSRLVAEYIYDSTRMVADTTLDKLYECDFELDDTQGTNFERTVSGYGDEQDVFAVWTMDEADEEYNSGAMVADTALDKLYACDFELDDTQGTNFETADEPNSPPLDIVGTEWSMEVEDTQAFSADSITATSYSSLDYEWDMES